MRRLLLLLGLWLTLALPAAGATYTFRGDVYGWQTASTVISWDRLCTSFPGDDDQATITFTGGFTFRFAGVAYSSVRVLSNGALQFGAETGFHRTYTNTTLPAGTPTNVGGCARATPARTIMVYWTDVRPDLAGNVTWGQSGTAPNRQVVVSWNGVYVEGTNRTFQIVLYENGTFKFQYQDSNGTGSDATIGVQVSGTDYTQYSFNTASISAGTALRGTTTFLVGKYNFEEASYSGTAGELLDTAGYSPTRYNGTAQGSPLPSRGSALPARSGATGTCGYASLPGPNVNGGVFQITGLPLSTVAGDQTTVAFWMYWLGVDGQMPFGFNVHDLWLTSGNFGFNTGTGDVYGTVSTGLANGWHHVVAVFTNGSVTSNALYIDGVPMTLSQRQGTPNLSAAVAASTAIVGGWSVNTSYRFSGYIDELRVYRGALTAGEVSVLYAETHACPTVPVDHYELAVPSASLACSTSTVTVTACTNSSSPCTSASTSLAGQTATLATSAGTLGATTVTFNSAGLATTTLSYGGAANGATAAVTLSGESTAAANARKCCPDGASCAAANSCSTTFSTAGFLIAAATGGASTTVATQTAGTASATHYLRAVKTGTSTQTCEAALTGAQTVDWAAQCNNPGTCSTGNLMTVTGSAATAVPGNPATGVASYGSVAMNFDANGNAPFTFNYADVGQVTLHARKTSAGLQTTTLAGNSNAFVVKPGGLAITNVRQAAAPNLANPGAVDATGAKFVKAGESFNATVTARTSGGAATPNFGRESTPAGVTFSAALSQPSGGTSGTLSGGSVAGSSFASGAATATLSYSEVGVIGLSATITGGTYLGASGVPTSGSVTVGRFIPARFAASAGTVTHRSGLSCGVTPSFSYQGENFRLGLTLTAQNVAGGTTANYTGAFAKFAPATASNWNLAGADGATLFTVANGRLALGSATGSFSNGVASGVTLTAQVLRASAPDGPFNAGFGIAPVDSDGVAMAAFDLEADSAVAGNDHTLVATAPLRFGRLRLLSAAGAADRTLTLPVLAEYWTGSAFDTNTLDSCTTVATTSFSYGNLRRSITTADTGAAAGITLSNGRGGLKLNAPTGGHSGTYDVSLSLGSSATDASCLQPWTPGSGDAATTGANLAYLRGAWCSGTWDKDPAARASFGLKRSDDAFVYRREQF